MTSHSRLDSRLRGNDALSNPVLIKQNQRKVGRASRPPWGAARNHRLVARFDAGLFMRRRNVFGAKWRVCSSDFSLSSLVRDSLKVELKASRMSEQY